MACFAFDIAVEHAVCYNNANVKSENSEYICRLFGIHSKEEFQLKKLSCIALTAMLLCTVFGSVAALPAYASSADAALLESGFSSGYREYGKAHADAARPQAEAQAEMAGAVDENGQPATFVENHDGTLTAVSIDEGSKAVFTVEVPESGLYQIRVMYKTVSGKDVDMLFSLSVDGALPFSSAAGLTLSRVWQDSDEESFRDEQGNEYRPTQEEVFGWYDAFLSAKDEYLDGGYEFYFEAGTHTLTFESVQEAVIFGEITLCREQTPPTYADYLAAYAEKGITPTAVEAEVRYLEGEDAVLKSHPTLYSIADYSSCITHPYDAFRSLQNTIGGENWSTKGQWLEWQVEVETAGFYQLVFRYKQNYKSGSFSVRQLMVDGEVPFAEAAAISFEYDLGWDVMALGGDAPTYLYLDKGEHTLRMEVVYGKPADICDEVQTCVEELNVLYRKVMMITGASPDSLRDYNIEELLPNCQEQCRSLCERLTAVADNLAAMTGGRGSETAVVDKISMQLDGFAKDVETIPQRLSTFNSNISSLASWLITITKQPLLLDYLQLAPVGTPLPAADAPWYRAFANEVVRFFCSFVEDYDNIGATVTGDEEPVTIWLGVGRDQAIAMQSIISSGFTAETGIPVNLRLVEMGVLMRAVASNTGPDLALYQDQATVINYALRGALYDLHTLPDVEEVLTRFHEETYVPFKLGNSLYALPENINYNVLFYRTDIMQELGLKVPNTWDDLYEVLTVFQKNNLEVGVVSSFTTATNTEMSSLLTSMIYQYGGRVYNEDGSACVLNESANVAAFTDFCELYTKYGLSLKLDLLTRFRTGQVPIAIHNFSFANELSVSAPEINGLWEMALLPGTVKEDGTVDHSTRLTSSGVVMFRNAKNIKNTWEFLKWWTSADAQVEYSRQIESTLGRSGRWTSANKDAMRGISWSHDELAVLTEQLKSVRGLPEVAGGYYMGRSVNNAVRTVVNTGTAPKETLYEYVRDINEEIANKRRELGLDG